MQPENLSPSEQNAIIGICVLAGFADGQQDETERAQIEKIVSGFSTEQQGLATVYQEVLTGKTSITQLAARLGTPASRALAYEMAVCVCHADGALQQSEEQFLNELRQTLRIGVDSAQTHEQGAYALANQPLTAAAPPPLASATQESELDKAILNASILNGALEIMPHSLATMAIIPLQMRMVYNIGKSYGYELDRGHIREFVATAGVGLTSQVFEGFTRRLIGGLARRVAGGLLGSIAGQAAGSAFAFATTYALGQAAKKYYASGRTLSGGQIKEVFASMLEQGRSLQGRYSGDISQKARQVNVADLVPLIRQA